MSVTGGPKVSIITPAYNAEKLIGNTIKSVVDQSFSDWEMIVIDDCSTDGTREVVAQWSDIDSRIRLEPLAKNFGGPAGPRNVGVNLANGEYLAFLDSDDIWHPRKLEIQLELLERERASMVCSRMLDFSREEDIVFPDIDNVHFERINFSQQSTRARIPTSSVVASRDLLIRHPFREDISYKAVEDYHCWLRMLQSCGECLKVDEPLLYYRKIEGQISGSKIYMMRKVFMVHREFPNRSTFDAFYLTFCHVLGGLYFRFFKKGM